MTAAGNKAVFLSYASQDAEAAKCICDALRQAGIEVWFDQNELVGGDAWDAKIRRQIAECALFVPIISAATQARHEGYFRLEWKLAAQRTHMMSGVKAFLLPVVIDETHDTEAHVPEEFKAVQWTRLRPSGYGGQARPGAVGEGGEGRDEALDAFSARVQKLLGGADAVGAALRRDGAGESRREAAPTAKPSRARPWLVPAVAIVAGVAGLAIWQLWPTGASKPPPAPARGGEEDRPRQPVAGSTASEAQRLTQQALASLEDPLATREVLRFAEELAQKAVAADVTDGRAVAVQARVSLALINDRYDTSPERHQAARTFAERALRLAPDSPETVLAFAGYLNVTGQFAEAERRTAQALARQPEDRRLLRERARALQGLQRFDEATAVIERSAGLPGGDAEALTMEADRLFWSLRIAEADRLLDRALAQTPTKRTYETKLRVVLRGWGDLTASREVIAGLPASLQLEDVFTVYAATVWRQLGDVEKTLEVLRRVQRDFFEDSIVSAPKSIYTAVTLLPENRREAFNLEATQALAILDRRLAIEPNRGDWIFWRAMILALLGRHDEARRGLALYEQLGNRLGRGRQLRMLFLLGETEAAIAEAERSIRARDIDALFTFHDLRAEPIYRELRQNPRVLAALAEGETWLAELRGTGKVAGGRPTQVSAPPGPADLSVAVLAFANLSDDKANEYFSDGISEEILNALANNPALRVAGRTSSFSFKGKSATNVEIGRALNVARVIEGSVRKAGTKVRITVKLINAADGYQAWSEAFDRELSDVFAVQAEIAARVVQKLGGAASAASAPGANAPTKSLAAYDAYLRGRAWQTGEARATGRTGSARIHFEEAIRLDPEFALAWARLAQFQINRLIGGFNRSERAAAEARSSAETAVRLGPELPEARLAIALARLHVDRDFDAARRELAEAERRRPNDAEVIAAHAQLDWVSGRWGPNWGPRAAALIARSLELDPRNTAMMDSLSQILTEAGRFADAASLCERWLELRPGSLDARLRQSRNTLTWTGDLAGALAPFEGWTGGGERVPMAQGAIQAARGDLAAAIAEYDEVRNLTRLNAGQSGPRGNAFLAALWSARLEARRGNMARAAERQSEALERARQYAVDLPELDRGPAYLALIRAARGEETAALAAMGEALKISELRRDASQLAFIRRYKADVLAMLGRKAEAIAELRALHELGYAHGYRLRVEPEWEPLRGEPGFQQLMKEAEARADAQPRPRK